jgi:hypothetical protein
VALYLVVHHRKDEHQPYTNQWIEDDDRLLKLIAMTPEVAECCEKARRANTRVFVHRCGWTDEPPTICCSVLVHKVWRVSGGSPWVEFAEAAPIEADPPFSPRQGQNFYVANPVREV